MHFLPTRRWGKTTPKACPLLSIPHADVQCDVFSRFGCSFFAYSWKLPAYNWKLPAYLQLIILAFLLTVGAFLLTVLASLLTVGAFFAYSGKVRLIRAFRDCKKKRSLTVRKKALLGPNWGLFLHQRVPH